MNYMANHYNEEIKHLPIYKHKLKNTINNTIKELTKAEAELFEKVYAIDDNEIGDKLSANLMIFVDEMIKNTNFPEFCKLQEIVIAFTIDPKSIIGISNKILKKHNRDKKLKMEKIAAEKT